MLIPDRIVEVVHGPAFMQIATRSDDLRPTHAWVIGGEVHDDRQTVTVFVAAAAGRSIARAPSIPHARLPRTTRLVVIVSSSERQDFSQSAFAASNTDFSDGTVRSSSTGENGTGTSMAPMRLTGASR